MYRYIQVHISLQDGLAMDESLSTLFSVIVDGALNRSSFYEHYLLLTTNQGSVIRRISSCCVWSCTHAHTMSPLGLHFCRARRASAAATRRAPFFDLALKIVAHMAGKIFLVIQLNQMTRYAVSKRGRFYHLKIVSTVSLRWNAFQCKETTYFLITFSPASPLRESNCAMWSANTLNAMHRSRSLSCNAMVQSWGTTDCGGTDEKKLRRKAEPWVAICL